VADPQGIGSLLPRSSWRLAAALSSIPSIWASTRVANSLPLILWVGMTLTETAPGSGGRASID
jgi:hypothetical protein